MQTSLFRRGFLSRTGLRNVVAAPRAQPMAEFIRENVFSAHRERILYPIAGLSLVAFVPLGIHHLLEGDFLIGVLLLVAMTMLAVDTVAVYRHHVAPIPFRYLLVPTVACVGVMLVSNGVYGALWTFPTVMLAYFVMPRRAANLTGVAILAAATALLVMFQDEGMALRFAISLGLCLVIVNLHAAVLDTVHQRMLSQSLTDPLTGAFTRRHMETCVQQSVERNRRTGAPASLLVIDVDRFEAVNDAYGHMAADLALRALAGLLMARARKLDLLFRMEGGKFLMLVPDTHASQAVKLAEHIRVAVAQTPLIEGRSLEVSIGASELRAGDDPDNWVERANGALARAKGEGRNRVRSA